MARSNAATVDEYLAELPAERREVVSAMRDLVRRNLDAVAHTIASTTPEQLIEQFEGARGKR